ncbi:MAG: creatininase family protein [Burkholderiaceae bacterium]
MTTTPSAIPSGYWQDLATTDFARLDPDRSIALLPVSATEQHGAHLPLGTDAMINEGVVRALLAEPPADCTVLVLPALTVGDSLEHTAFAGTLSASLDALLGLWLDIGRGVARSGLRKLVIFNTHGGQRPHVDLAAIRLRAELGMLVVRANSGNLGKPEGLFTDTERAHGLHGGTIETSLMMHLRPDLVRQAELADFKSTGERLSAANELLGVEKPVGFGWMAGDLNANGPTGNAALASADKGAALLTHLAARLALLCAETARMRWPLTTT